MPLTHNIHDGSDGDIVFTWPDGTFARNKIPDAKTAHLWLFRWKLTPTRHMRETTPINKKSEQFRPGQEKWQLSFSGYIDQNASPGWFNEVKFNEDGTINYARVTLRPYWNDTSRRIKGDFWVERMDWTVAVDAPNQIDGLLKGTGDLDFGWE